MMLFKTFIDLVDSPLGEEDEELEKILIELEVKCQLACNEGL